jgi:hypothetical protein
LFGYKHVQINPTSVDPCSPRGVEESMQKV